MPQSPEQGALGVPATLEGAIRALQNMPFCQGMRYKEMQHLADRELCDERLLLFERAFRKRMKGLYIPMYAKYMRLTFEDYTSLKVRGIVPSGAYASSFVYGRAMLFKHCLIDTMPDKGWTLLGHIGHEVARSQAVRVRWGGSMLGDPSYWELHG